MVDPLCLSKAGHKDHHPREVSERFILLIVLGFIQKDVLSDRKMSPFDIQVFFKQKCFAMLHPENEVLPLKVKVFGNGNPVYFRYWSSYMTCTWKMNPHLMGIGRRPPGGSNTRKMWKEWTSGGVRILKFLCSEIFIFIFLTVFNLNW